MNPPNGKSGTTQIVMRVVKGRDVPWIVNRMKIAGVLNAAKVLLALRCVCRIRSAVIVMRVVKDRNAPKNAYRWRDATVPSVVKGTGVRRAVSPNSVVRIVMRVAGERIVRKIVFLPRIVFPVMSVVKGAVVRRIVYRTKRAHVFPNVIVRSVWSATKAPVKANADQIKNV